MDEGADTGDILSQVDFEISYQDDARSIYDRVNDIAVCQIEDFIPRLKQGKYPKVKQDGLRSNSWRKRNEIDGLIDFRMNSRAIYNLTRALTKPYVGAHIKYRGKNISIWKVKEVNVVKENIEPGMILKTNDKTFVVKSYNGAIEVVEHNFKILPKVGEYL